MTANLAGQRLLAVSGGTGSSFGAPKGLTPALVFSARGTLGSSSQAISAGGAADGSRGSSREASSTTAEACDKAG